MAKAKKTSSKTSKAAKASKSNEPTKVTRITAGDSTAKIHRVSSEEKAAAKTARRLEKSDDAPGAAEIARQKAEKQSLKRTNPLVTLKNYFVGAWYELRQVRWPDRKTTWGMTGALLAFTTFFVLVIVVLDSAFKYLFQQILG